MKRAILSAACLAALLHTSMSDAGETYPSKPVRIIVPFAPGGGGDITARIVSAKLSEKLTQQFVVDNRGGAGGLIGVELGVRARPDGYTVLIASSSFSATPATHKPKFDPVNNFAAVGEIGIAPFVLTVHPTIADEARFDREGVVPTGGTPAYFEKRVRDEYAKWLAVVDHAKIKPVAE